jgi:Tol biopolymer transport system component
VTVQAEAYGATLRERERDGAWRVLARGAARHPRLGPGARWVVYQAWSGRSWDVRALERASGRTMDVAAGGANETEPSWSEDGTRVLFASDERRGLFGPALYTVPFRP